MFVTASRLFSRELLWLCCVLVAVRVFLWSPRAGATLQSRSSGFSLRGFSSRSSGARARGLQKCVSPTPSTGSVLVVRASLFQGLWDLPGPGIDPLPPALAGEFFTTEPTREALYQSLIAQFSQLVKWGDQVFSSELV